MEGNYISDPSKILFLLKKVKSYNISLDVIYSNLKTKGSIRYVGDYSFEIYTSDELKGSESVLTCEFLLESKLYNFQTEVLSLKSRNIMLMLPSSINIWVKRKYPRKNVYQKLFMRFSFVKPLDFSKTTVPLPENIPSELKELKSELDKDVPNMTRVIDLAVKRISKLVSRYEFIFYKRGMTLPSSAIIAGMFKRPLVVENTSDLESYIKTYEGFNIITYGDYMRKANWEDQKVVDQIKRLRAMFLSNNISSMVTVPIKIIDDVIGFLVCIKSQGMFSIKDVIYIDSIASLISEAYIKNSIYSTVSRESYTIPVIDISAGGLRFEIDNIIAKFLNINDSLRIFVKFPTREVQMIGQVVRIDTTKSNKKLWVAVSYSYISNDDSKYILDFTARE